MKLSSPRFPLGSTIKLKVADSDKGVDEKVAIIKQLIYDSDFTPEVRELACALTENISPSNDLAMIQRIYDFLQDRMVYRRDIAGVDVFIAPHRQIKSLRDYGYAYGDCDDFTAFGGALLRALGFRVRPVVTSTMNATSDEFNHIFLQVYSPSLNKWITFDATKKGRPLGTTARYKRIKIYSEL